MAPQNPTQTIQHPSIDCFSFLDASANSSSFSIAQKLHNHHHFWSTQHIVKEEEMTIAASVCRLHSPFICCPLKTSITFCHRTIRNQRSPPPSYPCIRAIDLDQNTVVAISVGVASIAFGIGIPVFYESQIDSAAKRDNTQPCFPCNGSGAQRCRFCTGTGNVSVELGGGEKEVSRCINCDGAGSLTCTTCQGSGIQPRYLDRREFKDDD